MRSFKLFGYQIDIGKQERYSKRLSGPMCKLSSDGRHLLLTTPYGDILPKQINITVIEPLNSPPRAIVELFIDPSIVEGTPYHRGETEDCAVNLFNTEQSDGSPPCGDK